MKSHPRVCVFCGGSPAVEPAFIDLARDVGARIARRGAGITYGGARSGMMGALADGALAEGGEVLGVIPRALIERERPHEGLTELVVVEDMDARKATMIARSDLFIALPGGLGTLDELFQVATLTQIGAFERAIAVLDHQGYYRGLFEWIAHAERERFIPERVRGLIARCDDVDTLLRWLETAAG